MVVSKEDMSKCFMNESKVSRNEVREYIVALMQYWTEAQRDAFTATSIGKRAIVKNPGNKAQIDELYEEFWDFNNKIATHRS